VDVIGELLRAGHLAQLGDDSERARKLRTASKHLADGLVGDPVTIPATLIQALRPGQDSEAIRAAQTAVLAEWESFPNLHTESPTAVLQVVLLEAIASAGARRKPIRHALWYLLRTAAEFVEGDFWSAPIAAVQAEWSLEIEEELADNWAPDPAATRLRSPVFDASRTAIDLQTNLQSRAAQEVDQQPWPQSGAALAGSFSGYVESLIGIAEESGAKAVVESANLLRAAFRDQLLPQLRSAMKAQDDVLNAARRRIDLLWWQQSGYSPRLRQGYSELDSPCSVVLSTAMDLHALVSPLAPAAAEYVLAGLVDKTAGAAELSVAELAACDAIAELRKTVGGWNGPVLSPLLGAPSEASVLDNDTMLAPHRAAVLLFRDLQVRRLLLGESTPS
jgi:hypothetical protein